MPSTSNAPWPTGILSRLGSNRVSVAIPAVADQVSTANNRARRIGAALCM
jgi:hypothetical protein